MAIPWQLYSPRCLARTRDERVCRQPAMANGRCRLHGGHAPIGRANGNWRTGRYGKLAKSERVQAKLLLLQAKQLARDGFPSLAKQKIAEAGELERAWMDRYLRIGPKPGPKPKPRKPRSMPGGYPNTLGFGQFTKEAKAARAAERLERAQMMARIKTLGKRRRRSNPTSLSKAAEPGSQRTGAEKLKQ